MFISEMKALQVVIRGWAARVFPERSRLPLEEQVAQAIRKLKKEVDELEQNPVGWGEYADVAIILLDLAEMQGHDIQEVVIKKMAINYERKWRLESDGTYQHIGTDNDVADEGTSGSVAGTKRPDHPIFPSETAHSDER